MSVYVQEGMKSDLAKIIQQTMELILIKADFAEAVSLEFGDIEEADFSGYARVAVGWSVITINVDGNAEVTSNQATFQRQVGAVSNDIWGWALKDTDAGTPHLLHVEKYADAPRSMSSVGNTILLTVKKTQGGCP